MIIKKNKKKYLNEALNELSDNYLKELSYLVDLHNLENREEIINALANNIKNPIKIKNYYHNLNNFQKKVISDIIYNLDGEYIENYILAKYDALPQFERKNILFTNHSYPNYFSLFVYQKKYIPIDIQKLLKTFIAHPTIWNPTEIDLSNKNLSIDNNYNLMFYIVIISQLKILTINERKFKLTEDSKKILNNAINVNLLSNVFSLLYYTDFIKVKNRKIIPNYKQPLDLNHIINSLKETLINKTEFIKTIYPKKSDDFIKNILDFRNIVIKNLTKLKSNSYYELKEIHKFIEINSYNELKTVSISQIDRLSDLKNLFTALFHLGLINLFTVNKNKVLNINQDQINLLLNQDSEVNLNLNKEIIVLENFEIIIINKISQLNKLLLEQIADKKNNKNYKINKNKLLKALSKGLKLNNLLLFLENISTKELPTSLITYLNDLKTNKVSIKQDDFILEANTLTIEMLIQNKKFKNSVQKLDPKTIKYKEEIEKKLISYLIQLDYYIEFI